jgi:hypothetical protein
MKIHVDNAATEKVFKALRKELQPWRELNPTCNVAMGGDSHSGEWSIVQEGEKWLVFIGERGKRMNVSSFSNPWDAASYAGYRVTSGLLPLTPFPVLYPKLEL